MKKIIASIILLTLFFIGGILLSKNNNDKIKVAEVAHSVFYAPQYVADKLGYFKEEGSRTQPGKEPVGRPSHNLYYY